MCGKDLYHVHSPPPCPGSPPHVRERQEMQILRTGETRITPACAGKTLRDKLKELWKGDHPRMCGKDMGVGCEEYVLLGSPPHVRERLAPQSRTACIIRITPACAGKTVMDPFIFALLRLPTFKIYLISLLNI